jgi:hypothetical protein
VERKCNLKPKRHYCFSSTKRPPKPHLKKKRNYFTRFDMWDVEFKPTYTMKKTPKECDFSTPSAVNEQEQRERERERERRAHTNPPPPVNVDI